MERLEQTLTETLDSAHLTEQTEALAKICKSLREIYRGKHLTRLQMLVVRHASETLGEIVEQQLLVLIAFEKSESEDSFFIEKAKALLASKSSCLNTAGRVALVAYGKPYLIKRNQLTKKSDAEFWVGHHFDRVIKDMVRDAFQESKYRNVSINVAVDEQWSKFEASRQSIEKQLSRRIRAYEKELAALAEVGRAVS
jgi:hypothetical protein